MAESHFAFTVETNPNTGMIDEETMRTAFDSIVLSVTHISRMELVTGTEGLLMFNVYGTPREH